MEQQLTENTVKQFVARIGDHHHTLAGVVIAVSAAHAAALGEACMQISLDHQVDKLNWSEVTSLIEQMVKIKESLLDWGEQDAESFIQHMALREAGTESARLDFLCHSPAEISRLAIKAANLLQDFRPLIIDQVKDDLEITINLLASTAQSAMLLLDSNLHVWPQADLLEKYEPIVTDLEQQIDQLTPVRRIRK